MPRKESGFVLHNTAQNWPMSTTKYTLPNGVASSATGKSDFESNESEAMSSNY